jgi:hypothetical protein
MTSGTVLLASIVHPLRCGDDQHHCDTGIGEDAA